MVGMRSLVTLVRNLSFMVKNLQERSAQLWNSYRIWHARYWVATRLERADNRIREARRARPGVFWAIVFGIIPVTIVVAMFMSGTAARLWVAYHSNREDITSLATFGTVIGAAIVAVTTLMRHFA